MEMKIRIIGTSFYVSNEIKSVMLGYANSWRKAAFSSDVASVLGMSLLLGGSFKKCKDLQILKCEIRSGTDSPFYDACI